MIKLNCVAKCTFATLLFGSLIFCATAAIGKTDADTKPIKICEVVNLSGDFATYNIPKMQALKLAISQINEGGGVLGRPLKLITFDAQSNVTRNKRLVQKCIFTVKPAVIFGGYTESSLDAVAPIIEKHDVLFWLTNQGTEGYAWAHTFYSGPMADQQIIPGIRFMINEFGPRMYIIAADYSFGHNSALWAEVAAKRYGGKIIAEKFIPLGHSNFTSVIADIKEANPDFIVSFLVGAAQSQFYPQSVAAGITDIPKLSTTNLQQGYEHKIFAPPTMENLYVPVSFLEELKHVYKPAKKFVSAMREMFPDMTYVNQPAKDTYVAMYLTAKAWEKAGTTDVGATIKALESGLSFDGPAGKETINPCSHMVKMDIRIARVNHDHSITFVKNLGPIDPDWMPDNLDVCLKESNPSRKFTPAEDPHFQKFVD